MCVNGRSTCHPERDDVCLQPLLCDSAKELVFSKVPRIWPSAFDILNAEGAEVSGDPKLLRNGEAYCDRLVAISKRRIVDSDERGIPSLVCISGDGDRI